MVGEIGEDFARGFDRAKGFALFKGQLVGRAFHVVEQDIQVVGVDQRLFAALAEKIVRMRNDVLVEGRGRCDHDHQRFAIAAARAPGLLPSAGDRAGIAAQKAGLQLADVDAQFQCVGRRHDGDFARAQRALNFAPLRGQIAAAVAAHAPRRAEGIARDFLQVFDHHFHREPGARENDGLNVVFQQAFGNAPGFGNGTRADAQLPVDHRRVIENHVLFARRRAIIVYQFHGPLQHGFRQFLRVGDGRGAADKRGICAIKRADALQTAQQIGQVGTKNPPVGMDFINDDEFEIFKELHPMRMVGQNALVQHIGIGHHHMPGQAHGGARRRGRVSIVGIGLHVHAHFLNQRIQLRHLVAGERLGGEEIERAGGFILENGVEHGQVVAHGFARSRGRYHHDVPPSHGAFDGVPLVGVQPRDAALAQRGADAWIQPFRKIRVARRALGQDAPAGDALHERGVSL